VVASAAGRAHEFSVLFDVERPAFPAVPVATHGAAMLALQGIFAALVEREHTGRGQRIETSLLRALSVFDLMRWAPGADRALRVTDVPMLFYTVARTRDGVWLQFSQNSPGLFRAFLRALELEHLVEQERFRAAPHIADPDDARALRAILLDRVRARSWDEWQVIFAEDPDVSAEPFVWPGDALAHPQLTHTGDSVEVDDPVLGRTRQLGPLATVSARPSTTAIAPQSSPSSLLQGIKILELATWIATPMATSLLAELGARVIKIEPLEGDPLRRYGPTGLKCVQGKESITLDLKTTEGRDIVHRLAARADALVHNYRPGVPERLGIDDATLRARNPGLIYLYAASYGSTGPMSAKPAFHVTAGAICGGALAQAGSDGAPGPSVDLSDEELAWWSRHLTQCNEANPDFNAALVVGAVLTMALYRRARSGLGQTAETRMMASNAYALSEYFIDYAGRPPRLLPDAGVHGLHALYRLYQARAGWIFVAAPDDRDFARLCDALGQPRLAQDPRFSTHEARAEHDAELGRELEAVFAQQSADAWERDLTAARVACVQAYDGSHAAYIFDAPWAEKLGLVEDTASAAFGPYRRYGRVVRTERDIGPIGAADAAGAQTRSILAEIGYDDDQVEAMLSTAIVGAPA
jgi:crotonobetainyl-CoA:carnitine CoA-transferase CaiB-like acyl-CoA transferase